MNSKEKDDWLVQVFDQYQGRLLRYTKRFTDSDTAQEVVQEAYLRLVKEPLEKVQGYELPWLFRVCRNQVLDRLKKEGRVDSLDLDFPFSGDGSDQKIEKKQNQSLVLELMTELKSNQKEVVLLKFQEDLSYKEISEITGHSVTHVGVILHEALKSLRNNFQLKTGGL
jgi:RNA polymerase sigma-70 factor (ECF subfamily)